LGVPNAPGEGVAEGMSSWPSSWPSASAGTSIAPSEEAFDAAAIPNGSGADGNRADEGAEAFAAEPRGVKRFVMDDAAPVRDDAAPDRPAERELIALAV